MALLLAWLLASPAEAATCSGPACDEIKMETMGDWVWVRSRSRDRVDVEARLAKGPEGVAAECRRAAAAQPKEPEQAGVNAYVFDPLFPNFKGTPVYRARLDEG